MSKSGKTSIFAPNKTINQQKIRLDFYQWVTFPFLCSTYSNGVAKREREKKL